MSRESRLADAIQSIPGFEKLEAAELLAIGTQEQVSILDRTWHATDIAAMLGEAVIEQAIKAKPEFVLQLLKGMDLSDAATRKRLEADGDLRDGITPEAADSLLELGVTRSTIFGEHDVTEVTTKDIDDAKAGIVNQRINQQRAANNYNAAVEFIHAHPAANWSEVAALLTE